MAFALGGSVLAARVARVVFLGPDNVLLWKIYRGLASRVRLAK